MKIKGLSKFISLVLASTLMLSGCQMNLGGPAEKTADVVVVGSGATGLSAAIKSAQLGLKVILLEKNSFPGGTTNVAEGVMGMNSEIQKEKGIVIDEQEAFLKAEDYHHYRANQTLLKKFYNNSKNAINWLSSLGVKFADVLQTGNSYPTWHLYEGGGSAMVDTLVKKADELGVELLLETPGKSLIMKDGKVAGIKASTKDGKGLTIHAPVVILATGGYSANLDMIGKYAKIAPKGLVDAGVAGRTGDGINMALAAGASDQLLNGTLMVFGPIMPGDSFLTDLQNMSCYQGFLQVNEKAKRFVNEDYPNINFTNYGNARLQQQAAYVLFTEADLNRLISDGNPATQTPPLKKLKAQMAERQAAEPDRIFKADSLEALAKAMGLDQKALMTTVKDYNSLCDSGKDTEYGKRPEVLTPLKQGPFYSFKVDLGYFTTADGLVVNENAQVMDTKGQAIPGLYAGGSDAGGCTGDSYDVGIAPGSQQGWSVNSGIFAAEDAAKYLGK